VRYSGQYRSDAVECYEIKVMAYLLKPIELKKFLAVDGKRLKVRCTMYMPADNSLVTVNDSAQYGT